MEDLQATQAQLLRGVVSEAHEQYQRCFGRERIVLRDDTTLLEDEEACAEGQGLGLGATSLIAQWEQQESDKMSRRRCAKRRREIIERQRARQAVARPRLCVQYLCAREPECVCVAVMRSRSTVVRWCGFPLSAVYGSRYKTEQITVSSGAK